MTKCEHRLAALFRHMLDGMVHVDAGNIAFIFLRALQRVELTF